MIQSWTFFLPLYIRIPNIAGVLPCRWCRQRWCFENSTKWPWSRKEMAEWPEKQQGYVLHSWKTYKPENPGKSCWHCKKSTSKLKVTQILPRKTSNRKKKKDCANNLLERFLSSWYCWKARGRKPYMSTNHLIAPASQKYKKTTEAKFVFKPG